VIDERDYLSRLPRGGLAGEHIDGAFSAMTDHFVQEAFKAGAKRLWGIRDRSCAERRMWVVLDEDLASLRPEPPWNRPPAASDRKRV